MPKERGQTPKIQLKDRSPVSPSWGDGKFLPGLLLKLKGFAAFILCMFWIICHPHFFLLELNRWWYCWVCTWNTLRALAHPNTVYTATGREGTHTKSKNSNRLKSHSHNRRKEKEDKNEHKTTKRREEKNMKITAINFFYFSAWNRMSMNQKFDFWSQLKSVPPQNGRWTWCRVAETCSLYFSNHHHGFQQNSNVVCAKLD